MTVQPALAYSYHMAKHMKEPWHLIQNQKHVNVSQEVVLLPVCWSQSAGPSLLVPVWPELLLLSVIESQSENFSTCFSFESTEGFWIRAEVLMKNFSETNASNIFPLFMLICRKWFRSRSQDTRRQVEMVLVHTTKSHVQGSRTDRKPGQQGHHPGPDGPAQFWWCSSVRHFIFFFAASAVVSESFCLIFLLLCYVCCLRVCVCVCVSGLVLLFGSASGSAAVWRRPALGRFLFLLKCDVAK